MLSKSLPLNTQGYSVRGIQPIKLTSHNLVFKSHYLILLFIFNLFLINYYISLIMKQLFLNDSFTVLRSTQIKTYSWDNAQVVLVGNKCDMEDERVVASQRGRQLSEQLGGFST